MTLKFLARIAWHSINPWRCKATYGKVTSLDPLNIVHVCNGCGRRLKESS